MLSKVDYRHRLAEAERHIDEGLQRIERQRALIRLMEHKGHDLSQANALLSAMLNGQRLHEQGRQHVLRELQQFS